MNIQEAVLPKIKPLSDRTEAEKQKAKREDQASHQRLRELGKLPGNTECADCTMKYPGWAALPHGVFLCITCAQLHRHIGRHVSQVKAISTDEIEAMAMMGNEKANSIYLATYTGPPGLRKPFKDDPQHTKEQYVRNKYEHKKWFSLAGAKTSPAPKPSSNSANKATPTKVALEFDDDIWNFSVPASNTTTNLPIQPIQTQPAQPTQTQQPATQPAQHLGQVIDPDKEKKAQIMAMYDQFNPALQPAPTYYVPGAVPVGACYAAPTPLAPGYYPYTTPAATGFTAATNATPNANWYFNDF